MSNKELIKAMQQQVYDDMQEYFISLGHGGHYTGEQKRYAIELIHEYGIRATARILEMPRRTLQRWSGSLMSMLNAALPGFMNGQKGAGKEGNSGSAGVIIK